MILTEEMIKNLPVMTEEEEKTDYYDELFFNEDINSLLEEFNNEMKNIDKLYDSITVSYV